MREFCWALSQPLPMRPRSIKSAQAFGMDMAEVFQLAYLSAVRRSGKHGKNPGFSFAKVIWKKSRSLFSITKCPMDTAILNAKSMSSWLRSGEESQKDMDFAFKI